MRYRTPVLLSRGFVPHHQPDVGVDAGVQRKKFIEHLDEQEEIPTVIEVFFVDGQGHLGSTNRGAVDQGLYRVGHRGADTVDATTIGRILKSRN